MNFSGEGVYRWLSDEKWYTVRKFRLMERISVGEKVYPLSG